MAVGGIGAYRQCAVAAQQIDCLMEDSCLDGWNGVRILRVVLRVDYRVVIVESKRIPHGKRWQDLMIPYWKVSCTPKVLCTRSSEQWT